MPKIRSSEHIWCQLFSEPEAGSDLASLRATAIPDGDVFRLNGQKVWTTCAHVAHYGILLARTDPSLAKHKGLSLFALDLSLPGVTIRPLREITGRIEFNEVFFDDVAVPKDALLGRLNEGWPQALSILAAERIGVSDKMARLPGNFDRLIALARRVDGNDALIDSPLWRNAIGAIAARMHAAEALGFIRMTQLLDGVEDPAGAPVGKLTFSDLNHDMLALGLSIQGHAGQHAIGPDAIDEGFWQEEFLGAGSYTIGGGTSEIMRNMIAERILGLPKDPRPPSES